MARVTIERLLDKVDSRFELVLLASYRAHAIAYGRRAVVDTNDKYAVLALREMESGKISMDDLRDTVLKKYAIDDEMNATSNSFLEDDFYLDEKDLIERSKDKKINLQLNDDGTSSNVDLKCQKITLLTNLICEKEN